MKGKTKKILVSLLVISILMFISSKWYYSRTNENYSFGELKPLEKFSKEDYIEDFDYVYNTLKEYYPYFEINKEVNKIDWLSNYEIYKKKIANSKNDEEFYNNMKEILSDLNNSHTNIVSKKEGVNLAKVYSYLPKTYWQSDIFKLFKNKNVQSRYEITNEKMEETVNLDNSKDLKKDNLELGVVEGNIGYLNVKLMETPVEDNELFKKDLDNLDKFLKENKNLEALVIDIRGNGGGNSAYWSEFLLPKLVDKKYFATEYIFTKEGKLLKRVNSITEEIDYDLIKNFPKTTLNIIEDFDRFYYAENIVEPLEDSIKFSKNIYLLVDEKVYSSSEKLANFAKESGLATLIGETTGGDGIGDDPFVIALPNTGYLVRFAKELGVTGKGVINEKDKTSPDYEVGDITMKRIIENGKVNINGDKALEKVIELESK